MKDKKKLFAIIVVVVLVLIAVIVGIRTCKPKEKANPLDVTLSSTTPITSITTKQTLPSSTATPSLSSSTAPIKNTTTTAATAPATSTTTSPPSPFQGLITGTWSTQTKDNPPELYSGTFSITIDVNGSIQGSMSGSYSGTITGIVDLDGNLTASGTFLGGTTPIVASWQGKISVSGNSLSYQGTFSNQYVSGTSSGTGTVSH